jgi:hypothetical protein
MPSPRVGCLAFALLTITGVVRAEQTPNSVQSPEKRPVSTEEVRADDLALSQRALAQPTTPPPAKPQTAAVAPSNDVRGSRPIVAPELAQSATIQRQSSTPVPAQLPASTERTEADPDAAPKRLPYNGEAEMPGYKLQEKRRWWMIGFGGALFGLGYIGGIAVGADHDFRNGLGFTAIPLAGPWVALGMQDDECEVTFECSGASDESLAAVGIVQDIGGVLLAIGLASTREVWVRNDVAWTVRPLVGRERSGLQLSGTF